MDDMPPELSTHIHSLPSSLPPFPSLPDIQSFLLQLEPGPSGQSSWVSSTTPPTVVATPPPDPCSWPAKRLNGCPELCRVCGEQATGFHYDAISCNGCKTFFRRSVMDKRNYACKNSGHCFDLLPKDRRVSCRSCRFDKCVEAGMNPLTFQTSDDLHHNPISRKVLAKRKLLGVRDEETQSPSTSKMSPKLMSTEEGVNRLIDQLVYLEIRHDRLRKSTYNPRLSDPLTLEEVLRRTSIFHLHFEDMPNWPVGPVQPNFVPLDMVIQEKNASPCPEEPVGPHIKNWQYCDVIYTIEYAKAMPAFSKLDEEDKILLLKNVILLCMNITAAFYSYSVKSEVNMHPDGTSPARSHGSFMGTVDTYFCKIISTLIALKLTREEYVLLKAIILYNQACTDLSPFAVSVLNKERERLSSSLFSFSMAHRGPVKGPEVVAAALALVDTFAHQVKRQKEQYVMVGLLGLQRESVRLLDQVMD